MPKGLVAAVLFATMAFAAEVSPELAPLKDAYDAKVAELVRVRAGRIAEKAAAYLKLLAEAEAGAADAKAAAAIKREREGISGGLLAPATIPDLPAEIAAAHRSFFGSVSQDSADYTNAKKKVAAEYVNTLKALAAKNKRDSALLREISAERHRALYGYP